MRGDHMPKIPEHAKMRAFHGGYPDEPNAPNIRKCEQCGRLTAPSGKPCAYCGPWPIAPAAEREGEELTAEDRILMHRAFLRVVRPWEQRGVKWSLEPEYVNVMFDAVSAPLRAALLAATQEPR